MVTIFEDVKETYPRESFFFLLTAGTAPFTGKRVHCLSWLLRTLDQPLIAEPVECALNARVGVNQFVDEDISSLERQRFGWEMHQTAPNSRIAGCNNRKGTSNSSKHTGAVARPRLD